jgi:hypothetical protein
MRWPLRGWTAFWNLIGWFRRNRRQRRKAAAVRRRSTERRHALDTFEPRVVLNADAVDDDFGVLPNNIVQISQTALLSNDTGGPTSIASHDATTTHGVAVSFVDGTFAYHAPTGFLGNDSFAYIVSDGNGHTDSATVSIHVNTAPTLSLSTSWQRPWLDAATGASNDGGTKISDLLARKPFSHTAGSDYYFTSSGTVTTTGTTVLTLGDADAGALQGIAITAADASHGSWQYSLNGGSTWSALGTVGEGSARLLAANASTRIRFLPSDGFTGLVDPALTFRLWDQSQGTNGGTLDAAQHGGAAPFSDGTASATLTVAASETQWTGAAGDHLATSTTADGSWMAVGATTADVAGVVDAGLVRVYRFTSGQWSLVTTLYAPGTAITSDTFGSALAIRELKDAGGQVIGARLLVGASVTGASNVGAAYLYESTDNGSTWSTTTLNPLQTATNGYFGGTVALDGDTVLIGATGEGNGAAYVFERTSGGTWSQTARLTRGGSNGEFGAFGMSVAVQGTTLVVGNAYAYANDAQGTARYEAGKALVYTKQSGTWTLQAALAAPDAVVSGRFGAAVGLAHDAATGRDWLVVGSSGTQAAYLFYRTAGGSTWTYATKLTAGDDQLGSKYGGVLAVRDDVLVVGAAGLDLGGGNYGAAYVYRLSGTQWTFTKKLAQGGAAALDNLGAAVALGAGWGFAGAPGNSNSTTASGKLFTWKAANHAPTLNASIAPQFTSVNEDVADGTNLGTTVGTLLSMSGPADDSDLGSSLGLALVAADSSHGQWQYALGSTWVNIPSDLSGSNAFLLTPAAGLRFVPQANWNGTTSITYRAWDQTDGRSAGTRADVFANGGLLAYSAATSTATLTITAVNDAPTVTPSSGSTTYVENASAVTIDGGLTVGDVDNATLSSATVAITTNFNAAQDILAATMGTSGITASYNGSTGVLTLSGSATVAQYQTVLRSVTYVNTSDAPTTGTRTISFKVNDGTIDSNSATRNVTVTGVNDAPTLSLSTSWQRPWLNAATGTAGDGGTKVTDLLARRPYAWTTGGADQFFNSSGTITATGTPVALFGDVDSSALQGIAITAADTSHGLWQYSLDGGTSWSALGAVSESAARLLAADATTRIRFVPTGGFSGLVASGLTFRAWDRTQGTNGGTYDASNHGGATAFSNGEVTADVTAAATEASWTGSSGEFLGSSTTADGSWMVSNTRVYHFSNGQWSQAATLSVSGGGIGGAMAVRELLDADGQAIGVRIVAGAARGGTNQAGKAYVFESTNNGASWSTTTLTSSQPATNGYFGGTVAVDGDTVLVGATGEGNGAAYVFERDSNGSWISTARLTRGGANGEFGVFGTSVAVQGTTLVVGNSYAYADDAQGTARHEAGKALVYTKQAGTWTLQAALAATDVIVGGHFGTPVGLTHDAATGRDWLAVGSNGTQATYLFYRAAGGSSWTNATKLTAGDDQLGSKYGGSLAVRGDVLVVGAAGLDLGGGNVGAAYVYRLDGNNQWNFTKKLVQGSSAALDYLGSSVALTDGWVVAGAPGDGGNPTSPGKLFAWRAANHAPTLNSEVAPQLTDIEEDIADDDNVGNSVASILSTAGLLADRDLGTSLGLAIIAIEDDNGEWQYSSDGGAHWLIAEGTVTNALLLDGTARLRFVPTPGWSGETRISFRAWDLTGGASSGTHADVSIFGDATPFSGGEPASAVLTVTLVEDPPQATSPDVQSSHTTQRWSREDLLTLFSVSDEEDANDQLAISFTPIETETYGLLTYELESGEYVYTPNGTAGAGSDVYRFTFTDTSGTIATATLTCEVVNHAPTAASAETTVVHGQSLIWTPDELKAMLGVADEDPDDLLTLDISGGETFGTLTFDGSNYAYTAGSGIGDEVYHVTATDPYGAWVAVTLTIHVTNSTPTASEPAVLPCHDEQRFSVADLLALVGADDADDGGLLTAFFTVPSEGSYGNLSYDVGAQQYIYTPNGTAGIGQETFVLTVADPSGASTTVNVTFEVRNAAPIASDAIVRVCHDGELQWTTAELLALIGASDVDQDSLKITAVGGDVYGAMTYDANSDTFQYKAGSNAGSDVYSLAIADRFGASVEIAFTVVVENQAPVLNSTIPISLTEIDEGDAASSGTSVGSLMAINGLVEDADETDVLFGMALIAADEANGAWQYSVNNGEWSFVGDVGESQALLLDGAARLRFLPAENWNGDVAITFRAWDLSGGITSGNYANVLTAGGSTPYSSEPTTAVLTVHPVNDAPTFTSGDEITINEGDGPYSEAWASAIQTGPGNEANQTPTFRVTTEHPELFTLDGQPEIDAGGNLSFTVKENASGVTKVTVTLLDDGGTARNGTDKSESDTFTITVNPINDVPTFSRGDDVTVDEDSESYSKAWATSISLGPENEAAQRPTFTVTNDNPNLFATDGQPTIDAAGRLSFTLANNANGSTIVTVTLTDDGGTDRGGIDTSESVTFTITVNPVNDAPVLNPVNPPALTAIDEDEMTNLGTLVGDLTATTSFIDDVDDNTAGDGVLGPFGIALTTVDETKGSWEYSLNNGATWIAISGATLADSTALLLNDAARLRFVPKSNFHGEVAITFRAWDLTTGVNGSYVDASTHGGISPFSAGTATIPLTVNDVNDAPTFTPGDGVTVDEDSEPYSAVWATAILTGPANEAGQTPSFVVSVENLDLFTTSGQPAIDADGKLTFTLAPNATGSTIVTVTLADDGGTERGGINTTESFTFTITVNPVNDVPMFTSGGDITISEDNGPYSDAWASAIKTGPANEVDQTPTFLVTTQNPELFTLDGQPAIDAGGNMSFRVKENTYGSTTVYVTLVDDGGVARNGVNQSASVDFKITVTPVNDAPVLNRAHTPKPSPIDEDLADDANQGFSIGDLMATAGFVSDADDDDLGDGIPGPFGMALSAVDDSHGHWQYRLDGGDWLAIRDLPTTLSASTALLLDDRASLRFVPDENWNSSIDGPTTISFWAWDLTGSHATGSQIDAYSEFGASLPYYDGYPVVVELNVKPVNDAPTITPAFEMTLGTLNGSAVTSTIHAVIDSLALSSDPSPIGDVEGDALGIAVTGFDAGGSGTWQYDAGSGWITLVSSASLQNATHTYVAPQHAVVLDSTAQLRFVRGASSPVTTPILTYQLWDGSDHNASGTRNVDVADAGGNSAYSAEGGIIRINNPPTAARSIYTLAVDRSRDTSFTFDDLLDWFGVSDVDGDSLELQVTGGELYGSLSLWQGRYTYTAGDWRSDDVYTLTFNDQNGGLVTVSLCVRIKNLAPEIQPWREGLFGTLSGSSISNTVESLLTNYDTPFGASPEYPSPIDDADGDTLGIAVTGFDAGGSGIWQYNAGSGWITLVASASLQNATHAYVAPQHAVVLSPTSQLRFVRGESSPVATPTLTFQLWDGTDRNAIGTRNLDVTTAGGDAAYSADSGSFRVNSIPTARDYEITLENGEYREISPADFGISDVDQDDLTLITPSGETELGEFDAGILTYTAGQMHGVDKVLMSIDDRHGGVQDVYLIVHVKNRAPSINCSGIFTTSLGTLTNSASVAFSVAAFITENAISVSEDSNILPIFSDDDRDRSNVGDQLGLAVVGVESYGAGAWQYTLDGTTWTTLTTEMNAVGATYVSPMHPVLLVGDQAKLRFTPNGLTAAQAPALSYKLWDQSDKRAVGPASVNTSGGGDTAYSVERGILTFDLAPAFTAGGDVHRIGTDPVTILNWATQVHSRNSAAGGANEFIVWADQPEMFEQDGQPRLVPTSDPTKFNLVFTPARVGITTVHVYLKDFIGQGDNESSPIQTFRIVNHGIEMPPPAVVAQGESIIFSHLTGNGLRIVGTVGELVEATLTTTHGIVYLPSFEQIQTLNGANGTSMIRIRGTIAAVNAALDGLMYSSASGYQGSDGVELSVKFLDLSATPSLNATVSATIPLIVQPQIGVSVTQATDGGVDIHVSLSHAATIPATVEWQLVDGSAVRGLDYAAAILDGMSSPNGYSGLLSYSGSTTQHALHIPPIVDGRAGPARTLSLQLSNVSGAVLSTATTTITLADYAGAQDKAWDDVYETDANEYLNVSQSAGVLANDQFVSDDAVATALLAAPLHGTVELRADGSFVYLPELNFVGTDSFRYEAKTLLGASTTARVTIVVRPSGDLLVANPDTYYVERDQPLSISPDLGLLANDAYPVATPPWATLVAPPQHGRIELQANGGFLYIPDAGYQGSDSFRYQLGVGANAALGTASLQIGSLLAEETFYIDRSVPASNWAWDGFKRTTSLLGGMPLEDLRILSVPTDETGFPIGHLETQKPSGSINPTWTTAILEANDTVGVFDKSGEGYLRFVLDRLPRGDVRFLVQGYADGGRLASQPTEVVIHIIDAPRFTQLDENGHPAVLQSMTTTPAHTELSGLGLTSNGVSTYAADGYQVASVRHGVLRLANGTILNAGSELSLADAVNLRFLPDADFLGTAEVQVQARYNVSGETRLSDAATLQIAVTGRTPRMAAVNDSVSLDVDTSRRIVVAANDQPDEFYSIDLVAEAKHGTLTLAADGSFTYHPDTGFIGSDGFYYRVTNAQGEASVAAVAINVAPTIPPPSLHLGPNLTIGKSTADSKVEIPGWAWVARAGTLTGMSVSLSTTKSLGTELAFVNPDSVAV